MQFVCHSAVVLFEFEVSSYQCIWNKRKKENEAEKSRFVLHALQCKQIIVIGIMLKLIHR